MFNLTDLQKNLGGIGSGFSLDQLQEDDPWMEDEHGNRRRDLGPHSPQLQRGQEQRQLHRPAAAQPPFPTHAEPHVARSAAEAAVGTAPSLASLSSTARQLSLPQASAAAKAASSIFSLDSLQESDPWMGAGMQGRQGALDIQLDSETIVLDRHSTSPPPTDAPSLSGRAAGSSVTLTSTFPNTSPPTAAAAAAAAAAATVEGGDDGANPGKVTPAFVPRASGEVLGGRDRSSASQQHVGEALRDTPDASEEELSISGETKSEHGMPEAISGDGGASELEQLHFNFDRSTPLKVREPDARDWSAPQPLVEAHPVVELYHIPGEPSPPPSFAKFSAMKRSEYADRYGTKVPTMEPHSMDFPVVLDLRNPTLVSSASPDHNPASSGGRWSWLERARNKRADPAHAPEWEEQGNAFHALGRGDMSGLWPAAQAISANAMNDVLVAGHRSLHSAVEWARTSTLGPSVSSRQNRLQRLPLRGDQFQELLQQEHREQERQPGGTVATLGRLVARRMNALYVVIFLSGGFLFYMYSKFSKYLEIH